MREQTWDSRKPHLGDTLRYMQLRDLAGITERWRAELGMDASAPLPEIADAMDETDPESWNLRLEARLWEEQARIHAEAARMRSMLEPAAWSAGFEAGKSQWQGLPEASARDMRGILLALKTTYFAGPPGANTYFLQRRSLPSNLTLEFRSCAHTRGYPELCAFHMAWLEGYSRALNPLVTWQHFPRSSESGGIDHVFCRMAGSVPAGTTT